MRVEELKDGLGNEVVKMIYFLKHCLINGLMCILNRHFVDQAIEGYHS